MHIEALDFCYRAALRTGPVDSAIEFGSRDVNGSARGCWPDTAWTGIDLEPGPGVDFVADACDPGFVELLDPAFLVLSTEMLEHCEQPRKAIDTFVALAADWVLITCATTGRAPHSAIDGNELRDGEHYRNLAPDEVCHPALETVMHEVHRDRGDVYYLGRRNRGNY